MEVHFAAMTAAQENMARQKIKMKVLKFAKGIKEIDTSSTEV